MIPGTCLLYTSYRLLSVYFNAGIEQLRLESVSETRVVLAVSVQMSVHHIAASADIGPCQHGIVTEDNLAVPVDQFHHAHMRSQMLGRTFAPDPVSIMVSEDENLVTLEP